MNQTSPTQGLAGNTHPRHPTTGPPPAARAPAKPKTPRWPFVVVPLTFASIATIVALVFWPPSVTVATAQRGNALDTIYATGTVEAATRTAVRAKVGGTIAEITVKEGAVVKRGDLLAKIDNPTLGTDLLRGQADLSAAQVLSDHDSPQAASIHAQGLAIAADLAVAKQDLARVETLASSGSVSQAELDRARAKVAQLSAMQASNGAQERTAWVDAQRNVRKSAAEVRSLGTKLSDTEVRAPFDGTVLSKNIEIGEIITPNQTLFRLGDTGKLWLELTVDETDVARIREDKEAPAGQSQGGDGPTKIRGSSVAAKIYAFPGQEFEGHVIDIAPDADRVRKTFLVHVELNSPPPSLRSGMSLDAQIVVDAREGILVPAAAESGGMAWILQERRVRQRPIVVGIRDLAHVEVREGITPGEQVVVTSSKPLRDGMFVRTAPTARESPSSSASANARAHR